MRTTRGQQKDEIGMLEAAELLDVRNGAAARPLTVRSAVTNGTKLIAGVDGRSAEARRWRDLAISYADDAGGAAELTEARRALVATAATLTIQSEIIQGALIRGEDVDIEQLTRVANVLGRTLVRLGIKKRVGRKLSIPEFLAQRDAGRAQE